MKPLPTATVQNAVSQLQQGKSIREVSKSLSISTASVSRIRQKNQETIPDSRMGRPSKVSKTTQRYIARQFGTGKIQSLRQGQQLIQSMDGAQVHVKTVRGYINKEDLKRRVNPKRSELTKDYMSARCQVAKKQLK